MQPLYTDTALEFLQSIVQPDWRVFEYGGGGSTAYYASNCQEVCVVEHDGNWINSIRNDSPTAIAYHVEANAVIVESALGIDDEFNGMGFNLPMREDRDVGYNTYHGMVNEGFSGYASTICNHPHGYFDCIVVDGMARSLCLWYAYKMIKHDGIIVLDNSDRWLFNDMQCYLITQGFNRKDFWQPGHPCWCTSFFSKSFELSDEPCAREVNTGDIYHFG